VIIATRGGNVELREFNSLPNLLRGGESAGATVVNGDTVSGVPAAARAINGAGQAVAKLDFCVWRGKPEERLRIETTWQARFFKGKPNDIPGVTWFNVWEQTEASLTARNNAWWYKLRDASARVVAVYVLPPLMVSPAVDSTGRLAWQVYGRPKLVDPADILHFRGPGKPGELLAPSPIELHVDSLRAAIAKTRHEARTYDSGTGRALAAVFPREVTKQQAEEWRDAYKARFAGDASSDIRVFGGGLKIETIGLTMQEAQYVESSNFSVEEIARIFAWPASLIGGSANSNQISFSPEHESQRTFEHYVLPRLKRLEDAIRVDPDFFGIGARDYPLFQSEGFVRGDVTTESEMLVREVQAGIRLVDEARRVRGLGPLPDGVGMIPQITPVGGAPNPVQPALPPAPTEQ